MRVNCIGQIQSVVFFFVIVFCSSVGSINASPPSTNSKAILQVERNKPIELDVAVEGDLQVIESEVEIETLPCGDTREIKICIANKLDHDFDAGQITTSCGCIKKLPDHLDIEKGTSADLVFSIEMPNNEETFVRHLTLSSLKSGRSVRIALKCRAIPNVRIKGPKADFDSEELRKIELPVESAFEHIDLRKLSVQALTPEVIECTLSAESATQGKLHLEIDPRKSVPATMQTECIFEFRQSVQIVSRGAIVLRFPQRTVVKPEVVSLNISHPSSQLMVAIYSSKLHEHLKADGKMRAKLLINGKPVASDISCNVRADESPICMVQFEIPESALKAISKKDKLSLRFSAGDWYTEVACKISN